MIYRSITNVITDYQIIAILHARNKYTFQFAHICHITDYLITATLCEEANTPSKVHIYTIYLSHVWCISMHVWHMKVQPCDKEPKYT